MRGKADENNKKVLQAIGHEDIPERTLNRGAVGDILPKRELLVHFTKSAG